MKKRLFIVFAIMGLLSYGCSDNRDQATATGSGAGIERQQEGRGQDRGFEKDDYQVDDANITTPIDSRPDLEEEE